MLAQCEGGETPAMISEKPLLLLIDLGRVIGSFPFYLKSIILQSESLFTRGKLTMSPNVFPSSSDHVMLKETAKKKTTTTLKATSQTQM